MKISSSHLLSTKQTNNTLDGNHRGLSSTAADTVGGVGADTTAVFNPSNQENVEDDFPAFPTTAKTIATNNTDGIRTNNNYVNANRSGSKKLLCAVVGIPNAADADIANALDKDIDDNDGITATDLPMQNMPLEVNAVVN